MEEKKEKKGEEEEKDRRKKVSVCEGWPQCDRGMPIDLLSVSPRSLSASRYGVPLWIHSPLRICMIVQLLGLRLILTTMQSSVRELFQMLWRPSHCYSNQTVLSLCSQRATGMSVFGRDCKEVVKF